MAAKLPVWGIDVGQCSLKAMKLQSAGDQVELLAADIVEHDSILSQAESDATALVKKSLETFLSRNDLADSQIVLSVPGQQTLTRFTKLPPVEPKKIPDIVRFEASQQIPFDLDEVTWDYQVFTEAESPDVEVGIFAIRKELIRNHLSQFTDLGIQPVIVQASPLASYNTVRFDREQSEGEATILLDMGALATDLIVLEGNSVWSRPVPIGGNRFTEALVSAFKISFRKAEKLKRTASTTKYARQVFQAMRPVFADLVSEIQRSIGFYTSVHREAHITCVLGMGNAFKLPGLQKFLHQNLQIKVEKLSSFQKMRTGATEPPEAFADNVMSFAVAYGLAIQGLGLAAVSSNLLPVEVRRALLWQKKRAWFAASAACFALAAGTLWVSNVMAKNQIVSGLGGLQDVSEVRCNSVDQAEQIIATGATNLAPVERAAKIAGAAKRLKAAFGEVDSAKSKEEGLLKKTAELPQNNVIIPRILDVIHRAFAACSPEELQGIQSAREYLDLAGQVPREQRRELWIEELQMSYSKKDPAQHRLISGTTGRDRESQRGKPGWAIRIIGGTTDSSPDNATWLADTLIATLDRLGKEPNRGFYFDKVTLHKVMSQSESLRESKRPSRGARATGRSGREVRGGRGRILPNRSGEGRRRLRGRLDLARGAQLPQRRETGSVEASASEALAQFAFNPQKDALTGEKTTTDQRFVIHVVVRKADTPESLIPEEYKNKSGDQKQAVDG